MSTHRKREDERQEMLAQHTEKKRVRKLDQDALRAFHAQDLKKPRKASVSVPAFKKLRKVHDLAASSHVVTSARAVSAVRPSSSKRPSPATDDSLPSDHDEEEPQQFVYTDEPVFARRVPPTRKACVGCHMEDCIGCACMCEDSTVWIDHPDGESHFFPNCKKCGGTNCPGMVTSLENTFQGLQIGERSFHPRKGSEDLKGSETHSFYVVTAGHIPGIYTHWGDACRQVSGFSNCAYKKYVGWTAAASAWNATSLPVAPILPTHTPSTPPPTAKIALKVDTSTPRKRAQKPVPVPAPSAPSGSRKRLLYVYSRGNDTTIYADGQQASTAARHGLADGSFGKVEVTPSVTDAFKHAEEAALEVFNVSDFSDSD
ncbi:hypothetical protein K438DRAFT_1986161 [Mycena galopus ATCC 62051]|nr:hypothetical protein K438DRAFT_1986161 [Mycena galopus ATCC 62051]